ncbi:flagellar biosynthetic protein FliO [candidate division GN15 bacterium]|uniref:Flagellar protein n=1 Tax=candidate division GN15 bacterium TaxID=2072418 RepID=A0A855WVN8_9BACT|nr:MAG: flagellar biosynthetic protein FliO [candidate division GN15 bacterium]
MAPNNKQKRNRWTMVVLLAAALAGVILIGTGRNSDHAVVFAQTNQAQTAPADSIAASATPVYEPMTGKSEAAASLIKMLVALAVVIVCIYVGIFLLKKLMAKRHTGHGGNSLLEVIETAYIDPKKSLSLVRVADKSVLIGVTDNQISMLTELDSQHTQTVIQQTSQQRSDDGFMSMLRSASDKFRGQGPKRDQSQG